MTVWTTVNRNAASWSDVARVGLDYEFLLLEDGSSFLLQEDGSSKFVLSAPTIWTNQTRN